MSFAQPCMCLVDKASEGRRGSDPSVRAVCVCVCVTDNVCPGAGIRARSQQCCACQAEVCLCISFSLSCPSQRTAGPCRGLHCYNPSSPVGMGDALCNRVRHSGIRMEPCVRTTLSLPRWADLAACQQETELLASSCP